LKSSLGRAARVVVTERDTTVLAHPGANRGHTAALIRAPAADVEKVRRAVRAVDSAVQEGVIRGGGVGLAEVGALLARDAAGGPEEIAGWRAFAAALSEPAARIAENAALAVADLDETLLDSAGVARTVVTAAAHTTSRFLLVH
jgi:chaperonin GroEL